MRQDNKCGIMKKLTPRPDLNLRPPGYWPGATLDGQTWSGKLRENSTSIIINHTS